ncbi:GGDEF domain-containing protein [Oceanispirochaeta sp. M1]|uniref:GGDEF domain-containing protein n=1 Tax=Oceanispirochaeta sp. M1 TaxID=2283433 RepID=UPI0014953243|nr:GGDEF domain-containing protein [Oceanispirochaeta sp. M1]
MAEVFTQRNKMDKSFLSEVEEEYKSIDNKWLNLHYQITIAVVVFVFILECLIGILLFYTSEINTTIPLYLVKFLIIPSTLNTGCLFIEYKIMHSSRMSQNSKIFTVSLSLVFIFFIVYMVHSVFASLYFIFALSILLTAIYGIYRLTTLTAILSIISIISSELLIQWDSDKVSVLEDGISLSNFLISLFVLISFSVVSLVIIYFEKAKTTASLQKEIERLKLRQIVLIDELTGISNRIAFRNAMEKMEKDSCDNTYIFVMIDLDNFKLINDSLGHVAGDNCLIAFSSILKKNCGDAIPFRYGGDEFSILFKNTTLEKVLESCANIQKEFKSNDQIINSELPLSASIGVASYECGTAPSRLITNSDKALYQSKTVKNKVTVFNEFSINSSQ